MLKVGGENVSPLEVEALLSTHPAVHLAQVVGRPSERYGEEPVAFVELIPGGQATAAELIAFCAANVASYKVPREIRFVTDWPMSATKIQKFRLRELLTSLVREGPPALSRMTGSGGTGRKRRLPPPRCRTALPW